MKNKKVLLLGGAGALGDYLIPTLLSMDYDVDVVSLEQRISDNKHLKFIQHDCKNVEYLNELMKNEYNAIIDFLLYFSREEYGKYYKIYLSNTDHYIFLSSYRIYANSKEPITEKSDRLLDVATDPVYLNSGDYSLYKAKEEDMLRSSGYSNYTILRPAITYSKDRFQLVTLEARVLVYRMLRGLTVVLPEPAMNIMGTLSWSGDFAKMVSRLVLNPKAYKEVYTISTAEHYTWKEYAEIYKEIGGLKYITTDTESYLNILAPGNILLRQQLTYDRYFSRAIDNTKILNITGIKQSEMMPVRKGLAMELAGVPKDRDWHDEETNARMDAYVESLKK